MPELFEAVMIVCFGLSWPLSVWKSWRSRTVRGKSLFFEVFIWIGYAVGIVGKLLAHSLTYVLIFYILNLLMVTVDLCLYFRNRALDREAEAQSTAVPG